MSEYETIKESWFINTYGGLSLVKHKDTGKYYIRMGDCYGSAYYGSMTEKQVEAFKLLSELREV